MSTSATQYQVHSAGCPAWKVYVTDWAYSALTPEPLAAATLMLGLPAMALRPFKALPTQAVIVSDAFLCTFFCVASRLALSMMSSFRTESTVPSLSANVNSVPIFIASVDRPSTANVAVSCSIQFSSRTAGCPTATRVAGVGTFRAGVLEEGQRCGVVDVGALRGHRERGLDIRFRGVALDRLDGARETVDDAGAVGRHVADGFDGGRGFDLLD